MEQIERITEMERCLDASEKAVCALSEALSIYEAGKLPKDLKRGVLSEDAVYDLITENRELLVRMLRLVTAALETDIL